MSVFEAVPNFSEGRDPALVAALASAPSVIDVHTDPDHNRSVVTMVAADLDQLVDDVYRAAALAVDRIDLRQHVGAHPRVGAADVLPFVPLGDAPMAAAVEAAHRLGHRLWNELSVPVFFYAAASVGRKTALADIRNGRAQPDLGGLPHPTAGVACVGARPPLVAYNLVFPDLTLDRVRQIAREMRRLPGVQALALPVAAGPQLSMNLARLSRTGVPAVFERARELAGRPGLPELVGLCPTAAAGPGCEAGLLEPRLAAIGLKPA